MSAGQISGWADVRRANIRMGRYPRTIHLTVIFVSMFLLFIKYNFMIEASVI